MEEALSALGFETLVIARPSFLAGDREALGQPLRSGEKLALRGIAAAGTADPRELCVDRCALGGGRAARHGARSTGAACAALGRTAEDVIAGLNPPSTSPTAKPDQAIAGANQVRDDTGRSRAQPAPPCRSTSSRSSRTTLSIMARARSTGRREERCGWEARQACEDTIPADRCRRPGPSPPSGSFSVGDAAQESFARGAPDHVPHRGGCHSPSPSRAPSGAGARPPCRPRRRCRCRCASSYRSARFPQPDARRTRHWT